MKPTLFLFVLFVFLPLAFSYSEIVHDDDGKPVVEGSKYYIMPIGPPGRGGGVKPVRTKKSSCQLSVLQDYKPFPGEPVQFINKKTGTDKIYTNTPLDIEFTKKPECALSPKWRLYYDDEIDKTYVGIPYNREESPVMGEGSFYIHKYKKNYMLAFCQDSERRLCWDIGTYNNHEAGRRLVTHTDNKQTYEVRFERPPFDDDGIRSVV